MQGSVLSILSRCPPYFCRFQATTLLYSDNLNGHSVRHDDNSKHSSARHIHECTSTYVCTCSGTSTSAPPSRLGTVARVAPTHTISGALRGREPPGS